MHVGPVPEGLQERLDGRSGHHIAFHSDPYGEIMEYAFNDAADSLLISFVSGIETKHQSYIPSVPSPHSVGTARYSGKVRRDDALLSGC